MIRLTSHAIRQPRFWFWLCGLLSIVLSALVVAPLLAPNLPLKPLQIDTDPENMLRAEEPVRLQHNKMKHIFGLRDMIVVGVVNHHHPQGVFNTQSLTDIYRLAEYAKTISWEEGNEAKGVVGIDIIAPSNVDNIQQAGLGAVQFEWLMPSPPGSDAEALTIAEQALKIPLLKDTMVAEDKQAIALYIPLTSKNISYQVAEKLRARINSFKHDDEYYITGLPIAQDQFGVEMFKQMAVSAPLAMVLIFLLMWWFFRQVRLVLAPMIVALFTVIITMGLLIITGNTIHIMSSMIPIFIMPIAVLDAVHILSDYFDRHQLHKNKVETLQEVMSELSKPMLYTTLTTCAGFASLAFTPIPPVQVFGIFIAIGVFLAWLLTITLIPAYIVLMPEQPLAGLGLNNRKRSNQFYLDKFLGATGRFTFNQAKLILAVTLVLAVAAVVGIQQIQINDNPVKWFRADHSIRVADKALNERFAGTYMAYLSLKPTNEATLDEAKAKLRQQLVSQFPELAAATEELMKSITETNRTRWFSEITAQLRVLQDAATSAELWERWDSVILLFSQVQQQAETFKQPEVLNYISQLQSYLQTSVQTRGLVGKSSSLADIVKTVHRELLLGEPAEFRIPASSAGVGQTLITYQSSHRPQDLWHFVTPDYRLTNLWIQLKSGDNKDMAAVVTAVNQFVQDNPAPVALTHDWFGLTYINLVWQEKMVTGMLEAFAGSFVIVLLMMIFLFRSLLWGILSMLPLLVTIGVIYGVIGFVGKDYDMPVAVLSALSLGLAIDYAIHFLARSRQIYAVKQNWQASLQAVFQEPARAIIRNLIVIGMGFLPLLAAPLVPYQTVGIFISAILVLAGISTLLLLPALMTLMSSVLFKSEEVPI
jgi:uncharacterized protein